MKHPRSSTRNRGFQLTAEAAAYLSEHYPRPYRLTPQAHAFLETKSHRQLVDETIDEMEAQNHDPR